MTESATLVCAADISLPESLDKVIYARKKDIVINVKYKYCIDLKDCKTMEDIMRWMLHLGTKTWMEKKHLIQFSNVAMAANGISVYK